MDNHFILNPSIYQLYEDEYQEDARIYDMEKRKKEAERAKDRKDQVGSGDRSERIRTYNFPQKRVTDHRSKFTNHDIEKVLDGEFQDIIDSLSNNFND